MPKDANYYSAKLQTTRESLAEKIDNLYEVESVIDLLKYQYRTSCKYDENGDAIRDEENNVIWERTDCVYNTMIDEAIEFLVKKYA